jgi:hypothetical protein
MPQCRFQDKCDRRDDPERPCRYRHDAASKLCTYYMRGACTRGSECRYSHKTDTIPQCALQKSCKDIEKGCQYRHDAATIPCKYYLQGKCTKGAECLYKHDGATMPPCKYYLQGKCTKGAECRYRHPPAEAGTAPADDDHQKPAAP